MQQDCVMTLFYVHYHFLNKYIMAKAKTLKAPKKDLKALKQEKIQLKLERKQTRKRR